MTHISNMDEELNQESNTSKEADYSTEEEETGLQTEAQQGKEPTDEQLTLHTLHTLHSPSKRDSEAMEDENGILVHGTSCLGPRTLIYIMDNLLKPAMKVSQSTGCSEQNRTAQQACSDQRT